MSGDHAGTQPAQRACDGEHEQSLQRLHSGEGETAAIAVGQRSQRLAQGELRRGQQAQRQCAGCQTITGAEIQELPTLQAAGAAQ